jgi:putative transcriptional regulator
MDSPTPDEVKRLRGERGQREMAELASASSYRTWQNWELGEREMPGGVYELVLLKLDQHPTLKLVKRRTRREHGNAEQQGNEAGEV